MRKAILALAAVATIAGASMNDAYARNNNGGAIAAGVIGGLAAGAIIGGAIANSRPAYAAPVYPAPAYAPAPGYVAYDGYYAHGPVDCPGGYWARRPRFDQWGNMVGYSRPRFFCP